MRALSRRPAGSTGAWTKLFNWFERARDYYFSLPRPKFEAMTLGLALLFGLLVMPSLIYLAGHYMLKRIRQRRTVRAVLRFLQGPVRAAPELLDRARRALSSSSRSFRLFRLILRKL